MWSLVHTLHYKVLVVLLYLNYSKLGELSLLMSWSLMKSMFLLVNIKLFPRWSTVLSSFISLLKVFLSSSNPSRTDLYLQRDLIKLMASGWKMPSDDTATGRKLTPSLLNSAPTALSFLSWAYLTGWSASFFQKSERSWETQVKSTATGLPASRNGTYISAGRLPLLRRNGTSLAGPNPPSCTSFC